MIYCDREYDRGLHPYHILSAVFLFVGAKVRKNPTKHYILFYLFSGDRPVPFQQRK